MVFIANPLGKLIIASKHAPQEGTQIVKGLAFGASPEARSC
jgi:hypothetical protein